jgi:hypothetical protein
MAAGDVLKTAGLVVESFTVKENEDIEKGELVVNDGNGILAATAALAVVGKVMMALQDHDYSEETEHKVDCVVFGYVEAQKVAGSGAAKKGQKLMISATAGECTLFVKGDVTATVNQSTANAALDKNAGAFGAASADSADADTTQKMWL